MTWFLGQARWSNVVPITERKDKVQRLRTVDRQSARDCYLGPCICQLAQDHLWSCWVRQNTQVIKSGVHSWGSIPGGGGGLTGVRASHTFNPLHNTYKYIVCTCVINYKQITNYSLTTSALSGQHLVPSVGNKARGSPQSDICPSCPLKCPLLLLQHYIRCFACSLAKKSTWYRMLPATYCTNQALSSPSIPPNYHKHHP